ncbi:hypothetical protein Tco_1509732, partial [Tanacetum coccineum]
RNGPKHDHWSIMLERTTKVPWLKVLRIRRSGNDLSSKTQLVVGKRKKLKSLLSIGWKKKRKASEKRVVGFSKGEFYCVKFIVNHEEDDVEPSVIFGRLFTRLAKGIADFGNGVIIIHLELDPFLDNSEETKKFEDDSGYLLDIDFGDIPEINKAGRSCPRGTAIDIYKRFSILEEERPVIETMAYSDKYKKILDEIVMDKPKLDGEIKKEEEEAIEQAKEEALHEKEDPGAFIIPI